VQPHLAKRQCHCGKLTVIHLTDIYHYDNYSIQSLIDSDKVYAYLHILSYYKNTTMCCFEELDVLKHNKTTQELCRS